MHQALIAYQVSMVCKIVASASLSRTRHMHADSLCPDTCPCVSQSLGQEPAFSKNEYDSIDTWTEIFDKVPFSKAPGKNMSVHDILEFVKAEVDPKIPY